MSQGRRNVSALGISGVGERAAKAIRDGPLGPSRGSRLLRRVVCRLNATISVWRQIQTLCSDARPIKTRLRHDHTHYVPSILHGRTDVFFNEITKNYDVVTEVEEQTKSGWRFLLTGIVCVTQTLETQ